MLGEPLKLLDGGKSLFLPRFKIKDTTAQCRYKLWHVLIQSMSDLLANELGIDESLLVDAKTSAMPDLHGTTLWGQTLIDRG